jgi:hypothetical protein
MYYRVSVASVEELEEAELKILVHNLRYHNFVDMNLV